MLNQILVCSDYGLCDSKARIAYSNWCVDLPLLKVQSTIWSPVFTAF